MVVRPGIVAQDGAGLAQAVEHTFLTRRPRVEHYWFRTWRSPGTPVLRVTFDQPVKLGSVVASLAFRVAGEEPVPVTVEPVRESDRSWHVQPVRELPEHVEAALWVSPGVAPVGGSEAGVEDRPVVAFRTFPPPRFLGVRCSDGAGGQLRIPVDAAPLPVDGKSGCDPLGGVWLRFTTPIIKEVLRDHLRVEPDLAGGRTDYDPWENVGSWSRLSRRPPREHVYEVRLPEVLRAAAEYRLRGEGEKLRDEFDQPLTADVDFTFPTRHRRPRLHVDHDVSVLESGVDSHLPAVVTNLEAIHASFSRLDPGGLERGLQQVVEPPRAQDVAYHYPLRVRDWVRNGSGAVVGTLDSRPPIPYRDGWFFSQVTPFSVHLKVGHYNSLVWVTDLATGEPVAGAEVGVSRRVLESLEPAPAGEVASAVTGEDGIARLPGAEELDPRREITSWWTPRGEPHLVVTVRRGDDFAVLPAADVFRVDGRGPGESWMPTDWRSKFGHLRAWGFTAQGVYRAGDTVQYKLYVRQEGNRTLQPAPAEGYRLQVLDPMEKIVHQVEDLTLSEFGAHAGEFEVPATGAVGWYRFELSVGYAEDLVLYPLTVLVTDFTPAPFRVTTDLNAELFRPGDRVEVATQAALHSGGPYAEAATRITATLTSRPFAPVSPALAGFFFDSGAADPETVHGSEGTLDGGGELATAFTLPEGQILYGDLAVESAVRDDRGKRIAGRAVARFAGRDRYVGIRQSDWILQAGEPTRFEAVVTDDAGRPVAGVEVLFRVEHQETRASRVKGAGNAYLTRYVQSWEEIARCVEPSLGETPAGCAFTPPQAGVYRLTVSIEDEKGRPVNSSLTRWAAGRGRVLWEEPPGHHLQILPESETLAVGETARYLVRNPFPGARALVTVERYGVIESWVTTLADSSPVIEFPVGPDHLPGFYLSVVVAAPRAAPPPEEGVVDLGKPSFRIGYARTVVKDPYKELEVTATPRAEVYEPRQEAVVDLVAKTRQGDGPPIELAVAVLDEAVLDLLAGGPRLYDPHLGLYDLGSLDLVNYNLLKRLVGWQEFEKKGASPGGGGGPDAALRTLFKFVGYWNPSIRPDAEGRATIRFPLPDNLTGWRVLVVAVTAEDRLGLGQGSFRVNRPTEIRPALPNQVVEGDRFQARFTVMNRTDSPRRLEVTGSAAGAVQGTPQLAAVVEAEPFRRVPVSLPVAAAGPGEIVLTVEAGDELDRDALRLPVPVRRRQAVEAAATWGSTTGGTVEESLHFPPGMRDDVGRVSLVVSPTVIGNLEGAFDYLRRYPYLCWEQILTKGVMAAHFAALSSYLDPELTWPEAAGLPERTLAAAADFQAPNGGMTYWVPSDEHVSPYLSAYTAIAFGWLRDLGHRPPRPVEEKLHDYLLELLRKDAVPDYYSRGMESTVRSVSLAALAKAGKITRADVARYRGHVERMSLFGQAHYLQALGHFSGTEELRREALGRILAHAVESAGKLSLVETLDDGYARIHSSELRTSCAVLSALAGEGQGELVRAGARELPMKLARTVTLGRGSRDHWENTQENLFCTRALIDYSRGWERTPPDFTVRARLGEESLGSARFDDLRDPPADLERPVRAGDPGRRTAVAIEHEGAGRLYYALRLFFSPSTLERRPVDAGFEVRRELSVERDGGWVKLGDPVTLERGELVRVDLYLSTPGARNFVVVDDPVPGGLEPVNRQLATASQVDAAKAVESYPPDAWYRRYDDWVHFAWTRWSFYHRELRNDAARFYADYLPAGRYHLSYVAQVIVPGEFTMLPTKAEEMYDPDVFGLGLPGTLRVEEAVEEAAGEAGEETAGEAGR
ncbi:MAG: alpha-2-macroglobulin family protein [Thermoanaerobaculia bacterium]|nr:alpha-2-macroglobulin family protein [Thermoanaerobaculia bacterium]